MSFTGSLPQASPGPATEPIAKRCGHFQFSELYNALLYCLQHETNTEVINDFFWRENHLFLFLDLSYGGSWTNENASKSVYNVCD